MEFREYTNYSSDSRKETLEFLVSPSKEKFKSFTGGLRQAPRKSFGYQQHHQETLFKKGRQYSYLFQQVKLKLIHPWVINLYFVRENFRTSISWKIKTINRKLETADKRQEKFITRKGIKKIF